MTVRTLTGTVLFCGLCPSGCTNRQTHTGNLSAAGSRAGDEGALWDNGETANAQTLRVPCD